MSPILASSAKKMPVQNRPWLDAECAIGAVVGRSEVGSPPNEGTTYPAEKMASILNAQSARLNEAATKVTPPAGRKTS